MPRRTRIVATIGPATDSEDKIERLILGGMNVARLNMSHATHEKTTEHVRLIRELSARHGKRVAILMDTQGPAIRTGELPADLNLKPGQVIALTVRGAVSEEYHSVDVNYDDLVNDIAVEDVVLVDNGNIKLRVLAKHHNHLDCEVLTEGVLGSRRHINLPGVRVNLPAMTDKDLKDIELGIELGVDIFAMSFVREAQDVLRLRGILDFHKAPQKIVAKLEDQQGVRNVEEIIEVADGIMVARGDLGIEVSYEELPILQRRLVKTCVRSRTPVIVATHMLESMVENPSPTRAEVTDVANAVFEQADAIMLSGETSIGRYPEECVRVMDKIARRTERSGGAGFGDAAPMPEVGAKLAKSAIDLAEAVDAQALVVFTRVGNMPRYAATLRPQHTPVYAFTNNENLVNQLMLHWGTDPYLVDFGGDSNEAILNANAALKEHGLAKTGDKVVYV
ncbi:MAG: pyruvate kinase, partial [Planctomycetota bacterium]